MHETILQALNKVFRLPAVSCPLDTAPQTRLHDESRLQYSDWVCEKYSFAYLIGDGAL